jgi:sec-independent protein translocase protein TatB
MDFLGIGPLELIVVLVIAFIVVGPDRLPELARSIGKHARDLRALSQGLTAEWQREIDGLSQTETGESLQETLTKPFRETQSELKKSISAPLGTGEGLQETLTKPFKDAQAGLEQAMSSSPAKPAPAESSAPEQPDTVSDDAEPAPAEPSVPERPDTVSDDTQPALAESLAPEQSDTVSDDAEPALVQSSVPERPDTVSDDAEPALVESSVPEQPDTASDDTEHADN